MTCETCIWMKTCNVLFRMWIVCSFLVNFWLVFERNDTKYANNNQKKVSFCFVFNKSTLNGRETVHKLPTLTRLTFSGNLVVQLTFFFIWRAPSFLCYIFVIHLNWLNRVYWWCGFQSCLIRECSAVWHVSFTFVSPKKGCWWLSCYTQRRSLVNAAGLHSCLRPHEQ